MTISLTSLAFAVVQLDGSILNIALSQIGISLESAIDTLQWTVDAYFIAFAVLLLSAVSLSDRWGARRTFVSGFVVFSAASLLCGLAPNPAALIAAAGCALQFGVGQYTPYLSILPGQLLIRLGIGLEVPAMTTSVLAAVHSARSGVASGALNAVRQTGGAVGVALFGALMATDIVWGIRIAFVISGLLLLAAAVITFAGIRVPKTKDVQSPVRFVHRRSGVQGAQ
jgi:MFS transporter, DHA2 family, methylenomycin A resistance protein